jgi:hypothetical protein
MIRPCDRSREHKLGKLAAHRTCRGLASSSTGCNCNSTTLFRPSSRSGSDEWSSKTNVTKLLRRSSPLVTCCASNDVTGASSGVGDTVVEGAAPTLIGASVFVQVTVVAFDGLAFVVGGTTSVEANVLGSEFE